MEATQSQHREYPNLSLKVEHARNHLDFGNAEAELVQELLKHNGVARETKNKTEPYEILKDSNEFHSIPFKLNPNMQLLRALNLTKPHGSLIIRLSDPEYAHRFVAEYQRQIARKRELGG